MNKSYVIRAGRFTDSQRNAYEKLSHKYLLPYSEQEINFEKVFNNSNPVTLEIGFGMGVATAVIAENNPSNNYLGIEVHKPGIGKLLLEIEKKAINNIRIIEYDAILVVEKMISKNSLDAIHVFFPDPWPKKRHRKRRLMQKPFTDVLVACLKPGGYLYMVTDWEDYAYHAMEELNGTAMLKNKYEQFAPPQQWRPKTKFEQKGLAKDHIIRELIFFKK